jgi:hypothetical protein
VLTEEAVVTRKPGTGFAYSNVGYNLLELLIEDVTGQSFSEYMRSGVYPKFCVNSKQGCKTEQIFLLAAAVSTAVVLLST